MISHKVIANKDHDKTASNIDLLRRIGGHGRKKEFKGCLFVFDNSFKQYFDSESCYHMPDGNTRKLVYKRRRDGYRLEVWLIKMSYYDYV